MQLFVSGDRTESIGF
jgi:hypothetical protein